MYLQALATAVPPSAYTQAECWEIASRSQVRQRLSRRSMLTLNKILHGNSGIQTRHFAMPEIDRIFDLEPDELNSVFRGEAPALAGRALEAALSTDGIGPADVDALLVCTCTGYLCPGITSYVAERMGLRTDVFLQDIVGLGCGAAIPTLRAASHILAAHPGATVACIAVEVCSAAFYLDDDPGVLISACLFGDGAAATVWRSKPGPTGLRCFDFQTLHLPAERDRLRFEMRNGKLRNLLDRTVPEVAANAVGRLWSGRGDRPVGSVVSHAGGRDVLEALAPAVSGHSLETSARVLGRCGNMSSPSVLFVLEESMKAGGPGNGGDFWLVSFGAGFSAHSCRVGL